MTMDRYGYVVPRGCEAEQGQHGGAVQAFPEKNAVIEKSYETIRPQDPVFLSLACLGHAIRAVPEDPPPPYSSITLDRYGSAVPRGCEAEQERHGEVGASGS